MHQNKPDAIEQLIRLTDNACLKIDDILSFVSSALQSIESAQNVCLSASGEYSSGGPADICFGRVPCEEIVGRLHMLREELREQQRQYSLLIKNADMLSRNEGVFATGGSHGSHFCVSSDPLDYLAQEYSSFAEQIQSHVTSVWQNMQELSENVFIPEFEPLSNELSGYIDLSRSISTLCEATGQQACEAAELMRNAANVPSESFGSPSQKDANEPAPGIRISNVEFSAISSKTLSPGDYSIFDIVMFEKEYRNVVADLIKERSDSSKETKSGVLNVSLGAEITIRFSSPDIEIEDNEESRIWAGQYLVFSFSVMLPDDYKKNKILFVSTVYINGVVATKLKFICDCKSPQKQYEIQKTDIMSAFVSYASQDRNRVATILQGIQKARPDLNLFFDVTSLRSGEDWEKTLREEIERRDILYLCWSHFAKESKWVEMEWRYALEKKGVECIEPIPLELPVCPPPEELSQKHFNDRLLYIINYLS